MVIKTRVTGIVGATHLGKNHQPLENEILPTTFSGQQGVLLPTSITDRKLSFLHGLASPK